MARAKKVTYDGYKFQSLGEYKTYLLLKELRGAGYFESFSYELETYVLAEKVKQDGKTILREHVYTPDFWIYEPTDDFLNITGLIPSTIGDHSVIVIDVKPAFERDRGARFSINRKWVFARYGIFVNKLIYEDFVKLFN